MAAACLLVALVLVACSPQVSVEGCAREEEMDETFGAAGTGLFLPERLPENLAPALLNDYSTPGGLVRARAEAGELGREYAGTGALFGRKGRNGLLEAAVVVSAHEIDPGDDPLDTNPIAYWPDIDVGGRPGKISGPDRTGVTMLELHHREATSVWLMARDLPRQEIIRLATGLEIDPRKEQGIEPTYLPKGFRPVVRRPSVLTSPDESRDVELWFTRHGRSIDHKDTKPTTPSDSRAGPSSSGP